MPKFPGRPILRAIGGANYFLRKSFFFLHGGPGMSWVPRNTLAHTHTSEGRGHQSEGDAPCRRTNIRTGAARIVGTPPNSEKMRQFCSVEPFNIWAYKETPCCLGLYLAGNKYLLLLVFCVEQDKTTLTHTHVPKFFEFRHVASLQAFQEKSNHANCNPCRVTWPSHGPCWQYHVTRPSPPPTLCMY